MADGSLFSMAFQGMNNLPVLRQLGLLIGLAASVAAGVAIVLWSQSPNFSQLYGNLSEKDANEVIQTLQQQGVSYKIEEGSGSIMVPARDLHEARLKLAASGLPRGTGIGFESLREDAGFGTSQFIETARYYRSLEVELARSIGKINNVESARVHLAIPKGSVFVRNRQKPTASVVVHLHSGRSLDESQVAAITHLVSSGIPEMEAGDVTVIDQKGRLLSGVRKSQQMTLTSDQFEYTQRLERHFIDRVISILTPIVGAEGVQAQVVADVDFTVTEQTQELFNPDTSALRSQQVSEEQSAGLADGGVPGALSNQPPGEAAVPEQIKGAEGAAASAPPKNAKRRSTMNYEIDKTISHTRLAPGRIKRLTVAAVVDDRLLAGGERRQHTPEEIERLTQLVKDAVGFDLQRGDSVSLNNIAFTQPGEAAPLPEPAMWEEPWFWDISKQVLGGLVLLMLVFGLLRPIMRTLIEKAPAPVARTGAPAMAGGGGLAEDQLALTHAGESRMIAPPVMPHEEKIKNIRSLAENEPQLVAEVLKGWVANDESK